MKRAVFASLILHAFVLLLFAVGIGDPFQTTLKNQQPLLIDFVQIAETSAAPQLSPSQKLEAAKPKPESVPPEPEKKPEPSQPEATTAETHPPVKAEKTSTPEEKKSPQHQESLQDSKPEDVAPVLKKEPKKEPKKEEKKQEPPKPKKPEVKKDQPKKAEKKPTKAEINLKKDKSVKKTNQKPDSKAKKQPRAALDDLLKDVSQNDDTNEGDEGAPAQTVGPVVTASEIDVLRQHIRKCWVVPAGIKGAKDMTVDIKMEIGKDGTVRKAEIVHENRMAQDSAFRTAAESAQRAVLDPQCNPLPLPKEKYDQWKDLEFSFNPKDMY